MGEGAVPVKYLDDEGKCKAREMEYLGTLILNSPEGAKKKEHDPEKMNENNDIRKDLVKHSFLSIYHNKGRGDFSLPARNRSRLREAPLRRA
jgi:hypothetical protein